MYLPLLNANFLFLNHGIELVGCSKTSCCNKKRIICFPASTPPLIWENKINPRGQWYNHDYNEMSHQDAHFNFSAPLVSVIFDFFALNYWWMNCRVNPDMKFKSKVTKIIKFLEFFIALFKLGLSCSAVNSQGGPSRGLLLFFTS